MQLPVVTPKEMYALDNSMITGYQIPSPVLMENAAGSVYQELCKRFRNLQDKKTVIFAGPGKNGEDGLVLARQLAANNCCVVVAVLPSPSSRNASLSVKINTLHQMNITILEEEIPKLSEFDIVVDAIFGIGLSREPEGIYKDAIQKINNASSYVVSLDIPSGIAAESGKKLDIAIECDLCVSFGLLKLGNLLAYGYAHTNELTLSTLFSPYVDQMTASDCDLFINLPIQLSLRDKTGYKNTFGKCLVVGGSSHYHGAPLFAAEAFMKAGGGYVHLATTKEVVCSVASQFPECVLHPHQQNAEGTLPHQTIHTIKSIGKSQDVIIFGPGIGLSEDTEQIFCEMMLSNTLSNIPIILDGDGLSLAANHLDLFHTRKPYTTILTPHLGEMSKLTGKSVSQIKNNLIDTVKYFATKWQVLVVLKGPRSIIVTEENTYINTTGTEALGTAGSGDVLDGIIASFISSPLGITPGLQNAVFAHGLIGNILSETSVSRCATASDILKSIPEALARLSDYANQIEKRTPIDIPGVRTVS